MNVIVTTADRFDVIPNKYFLDLIEGIKINAPNDLKIFVAKDTELLGKLDSIRPEAIVFPRCYGFSGDIRRECDKRGIYKIIHLDDIHYKNEKQRMNGRHNLFAAADIILLSYYENFLLQKEYSPYVSKAVNFPFHAPELCFQQRSPRNPFGLKLADKIFFSGRTSRAYPLRKEISRFLYQHPNRFYNLSHPGYNDLKHNINGAKYYSLIKMHKGMVVTSAEKPLDYPVLKYFEGPGCRSLCFMEKIPSLISLGFKAGVHYIEINKQNYKEVLLNTDLNNFDNIRDNAFNLVKKKHNRKARAIQVYRIIRKKKSIHWNGA